MENETATENLVTETKTEKKQVEKAPEAITYFEAAKVVCACGNSFTTGSTKPEIRVEICSNCHPFFTGQEKFVDTEGRVERFQRLSAAQKAPKAKKEVEKKTDQPKTLKEMLMSLDK